MLEFLLFGSMVWFWILFGIWALVLFISVENDSPAYATLATIIFFVLFGFWGVLPGGGSLLSLLAANPVLIIGLAVGFFALGTVWAVIKWWFYVRNLAEKRRDQIARYGKESGYNTIRKPLVRDNKSRIMTWMCFWPFSFIWTMINDPVRRIFTAIYMRIKDRLQKISDDAFDGLEPDSEKPQHHQESHRNQITGSR